MSADWYARTPGCEGCGCEGHDLGSWNLTYNLSPMLRAAGFPGWSEVVGNDLDPLPTGKRVAEVMAEVVSELRADPDKYRELNPPNGWGDYDGAVKTLSDCVAVLREHPGAVVTSWL